MVPIQSRWETKGVRSRSDMWENNGKCGPWLITVASVPIIGVCFFEPNPRAWETPTEYIKGSAIATQRWWPMYNEPQSHRGRENGELKGRAARSGIMVT